MVNFNEQTIVAQATPAGSGAIAMIRLSGQDVIKISSQFLKLPAKQILSAQLSHTVHYGHVIDQAQEMVDEVMLTIMHAPKTFTGEHTIEITCHNNPFIIQKIINLAISQGARLAQKGEFTQRAFLNGKIDLTQAEAINSLIHAHTETALKKSLAQLSGSLEAWSLQIERSLLKCIAWSEASFEFIEEEIDFAPQIKNELADVLALIANAQQSNQAQQQIKDGLRVAIIGSVNAGKSSLFNSLIHKERAIVTPIAGTTRDVIEAGVYTEQNYLTFVDTAGLRQTDDQIEALGIAKSFNEAKSADIILLVFDLSRAITPAELAVYQALWTEFSDKIILVGNKIDQMQLLQLPANLANLILVSTQNKTGLSALTQAINHKIGLIMAQDTTPFLLNQRQFNILSAVGQMIKQILTMTSQPEYEIISLHLNEVLQMLANLSGKSITEKSMDTIFREFCVGK